MISSILAKTNTARLRLSVGATIGTLLIHKLVKPIKVARSWPADQVCFNELRIIKAQTQMRAAHTAVIRETDPAVRGEMPRFQLMDRRLNQPAEFFALLF